MADYTATIDWGDGSPTGTGSVSGPVGGVFTASYGLHQYALAGTFTVTVTVSDDGGSSTSKTTQVDAARNATFLRQQASPNVNRGASVFDTATLSGGVNPGGTITFRLYGPNPSSCSNVPAVFTTTVSVHGNGAYASPRYTPLLAGNYYWVASYSGDAVNLGAASPCGGSTGSVFVHA